MDKDNVKYILDKDISRFDEYIEKADNKANFSLTICVAVLVAIIFQNRDLFSKINNQCIEKIMVLDLIFISIALIASIVFSLLVIIPRFSSDLDKSLFYFEDIKSLGSDSFYNKLKNVSEEEIIKDLSKQVSISAKICSIKMNRVKKSFYCLGAAIIGIIVLILLAL